MSQPHRFAWGWQDSNLHGVAAGRERGSILVSGIHYSIVRMQRRNVGLSLTYGRSYSREEKEANRKQLGLNKEGGTVEQLRPVNGFRYS